MAVICVATTTGLLFAFLPKYGAMGDFDLVMLMVGQQVLNTMVPTLAVNVWWHRGATKQTLRDLATTPLAPKVWLQSSQRPTSVMLIGATLALTVAVAGRVGLGGIHDSDIWSLIGFTLPANVLQSWLNVPMAVAMLAIWGQRIGTVAGMILILILLQPLCAMLICRVGGIDLIDSVEQYAALILAGASLQSLWCWYLHRRVGPAVQSVMERLAAEA